MNARTQKTGIAPSHVMRCDYLREQITLPFGWEVIVEEHHQCLWLRIVALKGCHNETGESMPWKGRKWYLSPHMTDGEIVQTAWLAFQTALEHEAREQFTFQGQSVFSPHFDIYRLVELRTRQDSIQERLHGVL